MVRSDQHGNAEYLANMCAELAALAHKNGFKVGSYLLEMASLEFRDMHSDEEAISDEARVEH